VADAIEDIYRIIEKQVGGLAEMWADEGHTRFTEKAVEFCREHILNYWQEQNFPESREFADLTDSQASDLVMYLQKKFALGDESTGAF
jgi:hypothetical protein